MRLVQRLAIGPVVIRHAIFHDRSALQHPLIETVLTLLPTPERITIQSTVTDPELIVTHVVRRDTDAEGHDLAGCIGTLHLALCKIRLIGEAHWVSITLHRVPAKAV
jgi:hypothetical protein